MLHGTVYPQGDHWTLHTQIRPSDQEENWRELANHPQLTLLSCLARYINRNASHSSHGRLVGVQRALLLRERVLPPRASLLSSQITAAFDRSEGRTEAK